jgi:hypothetical protein
MYVSKRLVQHGAGGFELAENVGDELIGLRYIGGHEVYPEPLCSGSRDDGEPSACSASLLRFEIAAVMKFLVLLVGI